MSHQRRKRSNNAPTEQGYMHSWSLPETPGDDIRVTTLATTDEEEGPSPGETMALLSAVVVSGAYIAFSSESPDGILEVLGLVIKVGVGGYILGYTALMIFGIVFAAYLKHVRRLPMSPDMDLMSDEANAVLFPESDEARAVARRRSCEIDHLVYACACLEDGTKAVYELTGVRPQFGGSHPGFGTHMALLSLDNGCYLEIIAPDPEQSDPKQPRPFGLDDEGRVDGIVAFAVHPSATVKNANIEIIAQALYLSGCKPGSIHDMSRTKPNGNLLRWKLTLPANASAGQPFVIDWLGARTPAATAPGGCELVQLTCYESDSKKIAALHEKIGLVQKHIKVDVKQTDGRSYLVAELKTRKGIIYLGLPDYEPDSDSID